MSEHQGTLFGGFGRRRRLRRQICAERERLYRIAWAWCHDRYLADDLVQETLTRALAASDRLRDEARLSVWLTQILANLYRDQFRRVSPDTGLEADTLAGEDSPEHAADRHQLIERTRAAIEQLKDEQRQVLTLVDVAEFSYADTAGILGVPVGTVMSRLSRARARLREILEQQGVGRADVVPLRRPQ
ncbi:MAG: RNA polymerase sigma factor [Chromatiaceae bacterium]|nr:RNA polymerase sigma factor [Gammaproteobacteria bacterium]MCP5304804.1 RNA polymerase sigma factor [Chromatiaceae bacterium]MCP5314763.1 RNA polymerase sigma factor [Chromatiaceae bacterium]